MVATTECSGCGAPAPPAGDACHYCGTSAPSDVAPGETGRLGVDDPPLEAIPDDLPPAQEARRFRGLAVPLVAAAVVLGIGYPLTALAVSQVGRLPVAAGENEGGKAELSGAVAYEGPVAPIGCNAGAPRLVTLDAGAERYSVLLSVPAGSPPGTYELGGPTRNTTFVAVTQLLGGSRTWTSLGQTQSSGQVTIGADRSVTARFTGLQPSGGLAKGTVDGRLEVNCA